LLMGKAWHSVWRILIKSETIRYFEINLITYNIE